MIRKFEFRLYYWAGDYRDVLRYELKRDSDGKPLKDEKGNTIYDKNKPYYTKVRNYKEIESVKVKPNNDIIIKCIGMEAFQFKSGKVMLADREIDVLNSAFCNEWNCTLPLIKHKGGEKNECKIVKK